MARLFNHYKFKTLLILARLGCTFPFHYSIWQNAGLFITIVSTLLALSDLEAEGEPGLLWIFAGIIGICMSFDMITDIHDQFTIKN